jgi:hypothetical protein
MVEAVKNLYNPHEGITGRDGGPYLDREEARLAEIRRAEIEGREPNLDNPPATAGIPLVTAGQLVGMTGANSNPSQTQYQVEAEAIEVIAKNESFPVSAHSQRAKTDAEKEADANAEKNPVGSNPAHGAYASKDEDFFTEKKTSRK